MHIFWRQKFFASDQTWTVSGQMATKEKTELGGLLILKHKESLLKHKESLLFCYTE